MPEPLSVAVVGCGYWGPNLARNFHQLRRARLSALCDADAARLAEIAPLYPEAQPVQRFEDVLNDGVAAVAIATPARTHYTLAKRALACGKHVLVEKPLSMSAPEAEELVALAAAQRLTLMVGHTFEYNPAVLKIKELVGAGHIGQLYYIYSNRVNLGRVQSDVNALWSIAPHDISIVLYLLDAMPYEVSARGACYLNRQVEDVVFLTLGFPGNVLVHVQASWLDPSKTRRMTIVGSEKMIVYDDVDNEGKVKIYDKGVYRKGDPIFGEFQYRVHSGDIHIPRIDMAEPLDLECRHFVDCCVNGKTPRTDGPAAHRVVQVIDSAHQSLKAQDRPVELVNDPRA